MAVRASEIAGNIAGRVEFWREQKAQTREDRLNSSLPPNQQQLAPLDLLNSVDRSRANDLIDEQDRLHVLNGDNYLAIDYWRNIAHMPEPIINQLVDEEGHLQFRIDTPTYRALSATRTAAKMGHKLIKALGILYNNNIYPLDASIYTQEGKKQKGVDKFNAHQEPHIHTVTQGALDLLHQAQKLGFRHITRNTLRAAAKGAAFHDVVNILTRKFHAQGAPVFVPKVIPAFESDPLKDRINAVAVFHNEPEMAALIKSWGTQGDAVATIQRMQQMDPAILATILADKLHIGQDRLPPGWTESDGILRDWHVGINAAFNIESAGYTARKAGLRRRMEDAGRFVINLTYNPRLENTYFMRGREHPATTDSTRYPIGRKTDMPKVVNDLLVAEDGPHVSHSEVLEAVMWSKDGYRERLRLTIMAAFAFNPNAQEVEFNIFDPDAQVGLGGNKAKGLKPLLPQERIDEIKHRQYIFKRDNIDAVLDQIQQKFVDKRIDLTKLKEAGENLRPSAPVPAPVA